MRYFKIYLLAFLLACTHTKEAHIEEEAHGQTREDVHEAVHEAVHEDTHRDTAPVDVVSIGPWDELRFTDDVPPVPLPPLHHPAIRIERHGPVVEDVHLTAEEEKVVEKEKAVVVDKKHKEDEKEVVETRSLPWWFTPAVLLGLAALVYLFRNSILKFLGVS